jgi:hypothetical protein
LANIFLNELDSFVETILLPKYNRGNKRRPNPEYVHYQNAMNYAKAMEQWERYVTLKVKRNQLPYGDPNDPDYRRLRYVRYADDFLLGFVGTKAEAEGIKEEIRAFTASLGLEMSVEKTYITHATTDKARFLGYDIQMAKADSRKDERGRRSINGQPILRVPKEVVKKWKSKYMRNGKPYHRAELISHSDYDIVATFGMELQGLANYYAMAHNVAKLYSVKMTFMYSLAKTLAAKHKSTVKRMMKRYSYKTDAGLKAIAVKVEREGKKPLIATFGAKPIRFRKTAVIADCLMEKKDNRNELVDRLLANTCEICGSKQDIEVHHIKKLADLTKRYQGRKQPPVWVVRMIEIRRKTLVVCQECHTKIHAGRHDGVKLK